MSVGPMDLILFAGGQCLEVFGTPVWRVNRAQDVAETITRSGAVGTASGPDGILRSTSADRLRTVWIGGRCYLLLEGTRENLCLHSADRSDAAWTKTRATIVPNNYGAPDGSANGDKLTEDSTASDTHYDRQVFVKAASALTYTYSVYARQGGRGHLHIEARGASASHAATVVFDLLAGDIETAAAVIGDFADASAWISTDPIVVDGVEWYRCELTFTTDTDTNLEIFEVLHDGSSITYSGDGSSGVGVFGGQLELGPGSSSSIATAAAAVTRNQDLLTVPFAAPAIPLTTYQKVHVLQPNPGGAFPRLWELGDTDSGNVGGLGVLYSSSTPDALIAKVRYGSGSSDFDQASLTVSGGFERGDELETLVSLDPVAGTLRFEVSKGGAAAQTTTIAVTSPAAWSHQLLAIGADRVGGQNANAAYRAQKVARGADHSIDDMRAVFPEAA